MQKIREVHIAPVGYEFDRISEPAIDHDADVIYLLESGEPSLPSADYPPYHQELESTLTDAGVEVRWRTVDVYDIYDVLGAVTTVAAEHDDDIVRVNVSSGTKLSAVGAAIASMTTDATGYFVYPDEYAHHVEDEPLTTGYEDDEVLPSYPIESPTTDQVAVMAFLDEKNDETYTAKKKDVIEFAEDAELRFITANRPANDKAKFALLNANIVDPLLENDYIDVESVGRQKQLTLTDTGRHALRAFEHKLS
jgi:hypothetical protein